MISLILLNLPVILISLGITHIVFSYLGTVDRLLCIGLCFFTYIVIAEQVLGLFNLLTIGNLYIINVSVLLVLLFIIQFNRNALFFRGDFLEKIKTFPDNKFVLFFIAIIIGFSLIKVILNILNAPFGWDSLNYHFTFAVEWLKHANLNTPIVISDNPCPTYFPINGSLIYLWLMFPFHNAMLADLGQVPFFIVVFMCIYSLCRKMEASKEYAFFTAVLFTVTPNYFKQINIAYVDIMVCAWFLMSLNFLFSLIKDFRAKNVLLFALSLGMLIGTKTIASYFSFILILFFLYLLLRAGINLRALNLLVLFVVAIIMTGGFSYIRNLVETGNPAYPLTVQALGKVIFKGVMDKSNFTAFSVPGDYSIGKVLFHEGMGAGTVLFIIPGLVIFILSLFKNKKFSIFDLILFAVFVFFFVSYRYVISLPNVRYIYPMFGLGYILTFVALNRINFPAKVLRWIVLACVIASLPEMARKAELVISLVTCVIIFAILIKSINFLKKKILDFVVMLVLVIFIFPACLSNYYNKNEFDSYVKMSKYTGFWPDAAKAWVWLNDNSSGNNIAYIGRPVPFPLYGTNFKNNVYYVSVNKIDPAKLHYFKDSYYTWDDDFLSLHNSFEKRGNYRFGADYSVWLGNLLRRNTDYLFVYSLHQTKELIFPIEDSWAVGHPEVFKNIFMNETIHIYKVLK